MDPEQSEGTVLKIPYTGYQNLPYILTMDILREALANGILDLTVICKQLDMVKRQEYLNQHHYKIYQNKDGRWCTYKGVLEMPCSRDYYYDKYRKFFWCLSRKP